MPRKRKQLHNAPVVTGANVGRPAIEYTTEDAVKLVRSFFRTFVAKFVMVRQDIDVERHEFLS